MRVLSILLISLLLLAGCNKSEPTMSKIEQKVNQFSPTLLEYDSSNLDENQKMVIAKLHEAAKVMDTIFLKQVYSKNDQVLQQIKSIQADTAKYLLDYFEIMFGPFDRLQHNEPFFGSAEKPKGANFYPEDMTKEEFAAWIKTHPEACGRAAPAPR